MIHALTIAALIVTASKADPEVRVHQHVVVVGVNTSVDAKVPALSYADDDAARYAETFANASSLRVLSVLDADTQQLFPDVAAKARTPTLAEFKRAIAEAFDDVARDRDAGVDADFVFVFVGHGAVGDDGEGYVSLLDAKLTRSMLIDDVIAKSPARFNHVIIDACSAYRVLFRGDAAVAAVRQLVEDRSLAHHPNTGVLLATSSARETHEWSRIRGGVFSHEVLGALSGAADVDGDGALRYAEVGAFIEAANAGVKDARAKVEFHLRAPPLFLERPLASLSTKGARIAFAAKDVGHFVVEDNRGITVAELHKDNEQPITVALSGPAPFRVVRGNDEWIDDDSNGTRSFSSLSRAKGEQVASRSGVSDALLDGLFSIPFGKSYVEGYAARLTREPVAEASAPFPTSSLVSAGVGAVLLVGAGIGAAVGVASALDLDQGKGHITAFDANDLATRANVGFASAAVLGTGAVVSGVIAFALLPSTP